MKKLYSTILAISCMVGALLFTSSTLSAQLYNVTFSVDMNTYTGTEDYAAIGVTLNGNFNGWCGACAPMDDSDVDGIYELTVEIDASVNPAPEWKFVIGAWVDDEIFAGGEDCTLTTSGFTNRYLPSLTADTVICTQDWEVCVSCESGGVPNDGACDALEFTVGDVIVADNTGATPDGPQGSCLFDAEVENDIWYFFTAPSSGVVEIETFNIGGSDDTQLVVYSSSDGTCAGELTEVGCNDDISATDYMSFLEVGGLSAGETYWLQIDGWQGTEGEFELSIQPVTNDEACAAFSVTVDGGPIVADNTGATPDGPQANCWIDAVVEADIWYFFTAPATGAVDIETVDIGGSDDTQVAVYSSSDGTCTGTLTEVGCSDDISGTDYMSFAEVSGLTPGDTYWIQIDGWQGTEGEFELIVSSAGSVPCPAPDAVICDNFDSYELGDADWITAAHWAPWPGGTVVSNIVDDQAFSNGQSLNVGPGGAEDQLLLLGNQTTGVWTVDFMMYIPAGANGYYNMQNTEATGQWNFDIFFNTGGVGDYQENQASISAFTWPEDTWFQMSHTVDLDNSTVVVELDGVEIHSGAYAGDQVGCINFYSIDATNNYYLDDVVVDGQGAVDPCPAPDAVICDNLDSYDLGDADWITAAHWAPWPGGTVVSNVVNDQAFSNSQSLNVGPGGAEDQLLLLGNQTTGVWTVDFMMYIPAGANGYYNMQNTEATGQWNFDIFFDTGGVGDYQESQASISSFTWPEDTWFQMSHTVDLNNSTVVVELDGVEIHSGPYAGDQVGCINFYSIDGTNNYYLDDVIVDGDPAVGLTEYVEGNFRIYPNPTSGLFIVEGEENIEAVVVRNVLGATVAQLQSNFSNRVELDLTGLNNGLYFVEITVDDVVSVQRLIKQ